MSDTWGTWTAHFGAQVLSMMIRMTVDLECGV